MQPTSQAVGAEQKWEQAPKGRKKNYDTNSAGTATTLPTAYSSGSGCKLKSFSPAAFFSAYFFIQASQLLPAAVSRPVKASAPISAYDTATFSFEFFGYSRTNDSFSEAPVRRSNKYPSTFDPSLDVMVTSPR